MSNISQGILAKCIDAREEEQDFTDKCELEVERKPTGDQDDSSNFGADVPRRRAELVVDELPPPPKDNVSRTLQRPTRWGRLALLRRKAEGRAHGGRGVTATDFH